MFKNILIVLVFLGAFATVFGQGGKLSPLGNNAQLIKESHFGINQESSAFRRLGDDTLNLPFKDDFYNNSVYPDAHLWVDSNAYINTTYPIAPPSIGVATLDGLNKNGSPYNTSTTAVGEADFLTSKPIRLGVLDQAIDEVKLGFFYQPKGLGEIPDINAANDDEDYLFVDFKYSDGNWYEVWRKDMIDSVNGISETDTFQQEIIVLADSFMFNGFQFRFRNVASLSGNFDHWHIDYVRLDTSFNTRLSDMAFQFEPRSLLKNYTAVPYNHFDTSMLVEEHKVSIKNNFIISLTEVTDDYTARESVGNTLLENFNGGTKFIGPLVNDTFSYEIFDIPTDLVADTVRVDVTYNITVPSETSTDLIVDRNNTIQREQVFANYYAYDDGSAERTFELDFGGSDDQGEFAVRFNFAKKDTLSGLRLHIPNFSNTNSNALFSILVYTSIDTINGTDDVLVYQQNNLSPSDLKQLESEVLNDISFYSFNASNILNGEAALLMEGEFFVAFKMEQVGTEESSRFKVGFDLNTDASDNLFTRFPSKPTWRKTQFTGAPMISVIAGEQLPDTLRTTVTPIITNELGSFEIELFPNPTNDYLQLQTDIPEQLNIRLYGVYGQLMTEQVLFFNGAIDMRAFAAGNYFLMIHDAKGKHLTTQKVIKSGAR